MFRLFVFFILTMCLASWSIPVNAQGPDKIDLHAKLRKPAKFPVFFVSDRQIKQTDKGFDFTTLRSNELAYGSFLSSDLASDKIDQHDVHFFKSRDEFMDTVHKSGAKQLSVFVHGYRKSFEGSLEFAEKIASEVDQPVVLFAWPSKNKYSAYMVDECTAEWSSYQLAEMLHDLGDEFGYENINLISHSLGARIVSWSLRIMATQNMLRHPFNCSLFFSPDFDRDTFLADSSFLKRSCSHVKVYLDPHDTRIWLSQMLHGSPRLGTMDQSAENEQLSGIFQFDTSMPSHHIPFPILSAAVHNFGPVAAHN